MRVKLGLYFFVTISLTLLSICTWNDNVNLSKSIMSLNLDIQESRKREDLLLEQIKLLSYQIDVLTQLEVK